MGEEKQFLCFPPPPSCCRCLKAVTLPDRTLPTRTVLSSSD